MRTNSLLANFENIETSFNPIKEIERFINTNYKINGKLQISKEPNENGKYEVNCIGVDVVNKNITSLTNGMFEWKIIKLHFNCCDCHSLTSLEGAPKKVGWSFSCTHCRSLTSLKGAPEKVGRYFSCSNCDSLTSLEGAPGEVGRDFNCISCDSLTSLKGAPKKVGGDFSCSNCLSLTSLKGAPKKVSGGFYCNGCNFTEEDVKKVCTTKNIYV